MSARIDKAIEIFTPDKCSCSQAIACAFGPSVGFDEEAAMGAARGFGGGIGSHGLTCGAVTGAVMVLGFRAAELDKKTANPKVKAKELVKQFTKEFQSRHGTIACKDLIGIDLSTETGQQINKDKKITAQVCPNFVRTAAEILDTMID
jgi:C_GCAxxG_C_C family probable redox protein